MEKVCGNCKWWHDNTGIMEQHGVRRCFAMKYPDVLAFQSTAEAKCIIPESFEQKGEPSCSSSTT